MHFENIYSEQIYFSKSLKVSPCSNIVLCVSLFTQVLSYKKDVDLVSYTLKQKITSYPYMFFTQFNSLIKGISALL